MLRPWTVCTYLARDLLEFYDARYGIYTFITTTEKPRELVIAEVFVDWPNKAI